MGIFSRVKTITKAYIHDMLNRVENPIAMLNEYSKELEQEMINALSSLSRQIFVENKQAALIQQTRSFVEKRTRQAKLAIQHENEVIVRLAVEDKIMHEKHLHLYEQQFEAIQEQTNLLKEHIKQLQVTITELQNRKMLLASRANVAQSMKRIQNVTSPFGSGYHLKGIAQAEDQILQMETEAQVSSQYQRTLLLDSTYLNHINEEEVNQEIEKLRK